MPDDRVPQSAYDQDFDAWTLSQAAALRAAGDALARGEVARDARLLALDWGNLAEEVEALGRRDRRELASRLSRIVEHLLKLEFSKHSEPRRGWVSTVRRERSEIADLLRDSPSLRGQIEWLMQQRAETTVADASDALALHGEQIDPALLRNRRYSVHEVIGDWLPDAPSA